MINLHLQVATHKIQGAEALGSGQGVEGVANAREGVGILAYHRIDFAIVNTESKGSILLRHQYSWDTQGLWNGWTTSCVSMSSMSFFDS